MSRLPEIVKKHRICVICEGDEEEKYFNRLISLDLWQGYSFKVLNAHGAGSLPARYQDELQNDNAEIILGFCDTDRAPHKQYKTIQEKLIDIFGCESDCELPLIYVNPCSMQVILLHFGDVLLTTQSKRENASEIERLTGVKEYQGHKKQIIEICAKINRRNYADMRKRVSECPKDDTMPGGTNFNEYLGYFENTSKDWIDSIKKVLGL